MMDISSTDCALARELVSADLDGELNELDLHRLDAHFRVCAECLVWAEQVKAATMQLREAPLEAPSALVFEPVQRRRSWRSGPALAAAPAAGLLAAVVVALGGAHGSLGGQATTGTRPIPADRPIVHNGPAINAWIPLGKHWALHAI
ncbi:MAG: hypothetical protein QOG85_885 [Gaiellaceae bacterium]|jgi:predicted anti-sigma-YlaC factor YlaD|nr:hypothetical protein [Gaiellaceae bacterium]